MKTISRYIVDEFTDYKGNVRKFIIAAVSIPTDASIEEFRKYDSKLLGSLKVLSLGISVCHEEDEFDEYIGSEIAVGKALKYRDHALYSTDIGIVNDTMVMALLKQEAEYFKRNPGRFISGYDEAEQKYLEEQRLKNYIKSLEGEEKSVFMFLLSKAEKAAEMFSNLCKLRK